MNFRLFILLFVSFIAFTGCRFADDSDLESDADYVSLSPECKQQRKEIDALKEKLDALAAKPAECDQIEAEYNEAISIGGTPGSSEMQAIVDRHLACLAELEALKADGSADELQQKIDSLSSDYSLNCTAVQQNY